MIMGLCPKPRQGNDSPVPPFAEACICFCSIGFLGGDPPKWEFEGETLNEERKLEYGT